MKKCLFFIILLVTSLSSCKHYNKKDLVGAWAVMYSTRYPSQYVGYNHVKILEFKEDGTFTNYVFKCGIKDFDPSLISYTDSYILSGEWSVSGRKIYEVGSLGNKDTINIESRSEDGLIVVDKTSGYKNDTITYKYLGENIDKAIIKMTLLSSVMKGVK